MERYPNLKEEFGGSIPGCEISFQVDIKLTGWLIASCALALASRPSLLKTKHVKPMAYLLSSLSTLPLSSHLGDKLM